MAEKHPYMSGSAGIVQAITHLRKSFPAQVTAETLKKLAIAPNNESYVINALRFIGVVDTEGKKTKEAGVVFTKHDDADFQKAFAGLIERSYKDLFDLHGKDSWGLSTDKLISYFRSADQTSAIVGQRQATMFQALAALSGHAEVPVTKTPNPAKKTATKTAKKTVVKDPSKPDPIDAGGGGKARDVGLTVRIEVNLPAGADQETYDRIFKSMRENLLNG